MCGWWFNIFSFHTGREKNKWKLFYKRALGGEQFTAEDEGFNGRNEKCFLEIRFNPIFNENGEVIGTSCFAHDTTRKKRIEHKVRDINRQYSILSKATNDVIWDWDLPSDSISWNHGIKTIFGYEERDCLLQCLLVVWQSSPRRLQPGVGIPGRLNFAIWTIIMADQVCQPIDQPFPDYFKIRITLMFESIPIGTFDSLKQLNNTVWKSWLQFPVRCPGGLENQKTKHQKMSAPQRQLLLHPFFQNYHYKTKYYTWENWFVIPDLMMTPIIAQGSGPS